MGIYARAGSIPALGTKYKTYMNLRTSIRYILGRIIRACTPPCNPPEFIPTRIAQQAASYSFIEVVQHMISDDRFTKFYETHTRILRGRRDHIEKSLEYYVSLELLRLNNSDICLDVASQRSPFPEIARTIYGCTVYKQDLAYSTDYARFQIGGNAASMDLPDEFCTAVTLHCSFEHFENDDDRHFITEAYRVLKPGGRLCIVPFYLKNRYYIVSDPLIQSIDPHKYPEAYIYKNYGSFLGFTRHYDTHQAVKRLFEMPQNWRIQLYDVQNSRDIDVNAYLKYILFMTKITTG